MDLEGLAVTLLDTAGLRETEDHVEGIGISRALDRAKHADVRVFLAEKHEAFDVEVRPDDIILAPKADTRSDKSGAISGRTGEGLSDLVARLAAILTQRTASSGIATRERHRVAMQQADLGLDAAMQVLVRGSGHYDIAAEELHTAIRALESLVGRIDVENVLDEIFASFCLGR